MKNITHIIIAVAIFTVVLGITMVLKSKGPVVATFPINCTPMEFQEMYKLEKLLGKYSPIMTSDAKNEKFAYVSIPVSPVGNHELNADMYPVKNPGSHVETHAINSKEIVFIIFSKQTPAEIKSAW